MNLFSRSYVKYGLVMAGVTIICLLLMEITGQNESFDKSPIATFFIFIAPLIVWFFGIRAKKKKLKNKLTFKKGLAEGFRISLAYAIISPFIFLIYYLVINPDILTYVGQTYGLQTTSKVLIVLVDMIAQFIGAIVFGTIYAAIISFALKSKK